MIEHWRQIYPQYEVSSLGRVRGPRGITKGSVGTRGYMQICVKRKTRNIHVLVAKAFLGDRPDGHHVCHKDGDKTNNKIDNLRYDTPAANWQDFRESERKTSHAIKREACPLGHKLIGKNLMPSQLKLGWRSCLACSRSRAYRQNGKDKELFQFEQLANIYYERLFDGNN
jgi:hypothetical protein